MKPYLFTTVTVLAVLVIAAFCKRKLKTTPDDLYSFENTMSGVQKLLPDNQSYSLMLVNTTSKLELFTRYVLAPRHQYYPQIATDTFLVISDKATTDSVMRRICADHKILWQNSDSIGVYTLVSKGMCKK